MRAKRKTPDNAGPSSQPSSGPWENYNITLTELKHQERFIALDKRKIQPTRFIDRDILRRLGILEDVELLCGRVGLENFIGLNPAPTSRRLTLEFLATVDVDEVADPNDQDGATYMEVSFQLMNQSFKFDYATINNTFGWDDDAPTSFDIEEVRKEKEEREERGPESSDSEEAPDWLDLTAIDPQSTWRQFTNDRIFEARKAKSSRIIHPAARYVHRLLVYSIYGRHELGAMHVADIKPLWLMTQARDFTKPFPINYAEQFIARMIDVRDGKLQRRDLVMGGMITILAASKVRGFSLRNIDKVSTDLLLDERRLATVLRWFTYAGSSERFTWLVGDHDGAQIPWLDLPDQPNIRIEGCPRANPFRVPRLHGPDVPPPQAPHAPPLPAPPPVHHPPSPPHAQPAPRQSRRQAPSQPTDTSSLQSVLDQMAQMRLDMETYHRRQAQEMDYLMTYTRGIYRAQVEGGFIPAPYLNYPHHPPQQGPVPGWHGGQPTYPYYPPRPEGVDYRFPGGSDPQFDPNFPPFDTYPTFPPAYYSSMPAMQDTWGTAPLPSYVRDLLADPESSSQPGPSTGMDVDD